MIICDSGSWEKEKQVFHPIIDQAIHWVVSTDLAHLKPGKYDLLPDNKMFCLLQEMETEPAASRQAESHFDYVDIQYLLAGEENIGVARIHPDNVPGERNAEHDIVFYSKVIQESMIALTPGMFAVFFPQDIHRPCCDSRGASHLRKAVVKIHHSLFEQGGVQ